MPLAQPKPLALKTGVNTRASLSERLPPVVEQDNNATFNPYCSSKRGVTDSTYGDATANAFVKSAKDVPKRHKEPRGPDYDKPPEHFSGTSTTFLSTCNTLSNRPDCSFFSRVRQIEKQDDATRHGLESIPTRSGASKMQRTVDIMRKRETDPEFCPVTNQYMPIERRPQNGIPAPTALETVRFTYVMPQSTTQIEYHEPRGCVAPQLDQSTYVQRRVISECASCRDLFGGTPKSVADVLPGYMSHVPADPSNVAKLHGETDVLKQYCKNACAASKIATALRGRSPRDRMMTTQGFANEQAVASLEERGLNQIKFGKKTAVLN